LLYLDGAEQPIWWAPDRRSEPILTQFLQICDLVKYNGVSEDAIRLRLFPFSLRDKARSWLSMISDGSIKTWEELNQKFLLKYFPPSKSMQLKSEITQFKQQDSEPLYEAWDRFRELLRRCPRHGFPDDQQLCFFYNGLLGQTRAFVDAAAGGVLSAKTPEEASNLLEEMAVNSYQWPSERSSIRRVAEVTSSDPIKELAAQMSSLTMKLNALTKGADEMSGGQGNVLPLDPLPEANYINNRNFSNYHSNPVPGFYHPNNRNHENFFYGNTKNLKDPGSFTVPCTIGNIFFSKALCDLGSSINLMPLSIFRKLGLGEVKPSTVILQLADRSVTYPKGIVEDVLVKIDKFIFPVDFVVLDMEEDNEVPLILERPFLAAEDALIDVKKGELTLRVNDEHVLFSIGKITFYLPNYPKIYTLPTKLFFVTLCLPNFDFLYTLPFPGIIPSLCMHKIRVEEDYRPSVQNQRRLNPVMQEVVRKEVLKWLDVGIIFAISDSEWVSPVQVVPKKGGMI
ncbi:Unknown protein, partial [Striga hermonthica]